MNGRELALRKELAVMHLRIAHAELARRQPPTEIATLVGAMDVASGILERHRFGRCGEYLGLCLRVARAVFRLHDVL